MKKEKLYIWIIIILFILNLLQLGVFLFKSRHQPIAKPNLKKNAIELLDLNEQQQTQFRFSAKQHRKKMRILIRQQRALVKDYFDNPNDSILGLIQKVEAQKIIRIQQNFEEIEAFLNDEQKENFPLFKKKAMRIILR